MSLVSELQQEALNEKASVVGLLRKALLVANKLDMKEFAVWIDHELNGYGDAEIPEYREVRGEINVWNPYRGYQPLGFSKPGGAERFSRMSFHMPIAELEHMLAGAKSGGSIVASFDPERERRLMDAMQGGKMRPSLHVEPAQLRRIVEAVRNAILKWALDLERQGISGEGLSFSSKEKAAAGRTTINIDTYVGSMHQSQIQRDTQSSVQTLTVQELDLEAVGEFIAQLEGALHRGKLPAEQLAELQADVASIKAQLASPKPKQGFVRECLASIRRILENAGGEILGRAPELLDTLKILVP